VLIYFVSVIFKN